MDSIHYQFGLQVEQLEDEQALMNYLLDAAPLYARICTGDISVTKEEIKECLGFTMPDDPDEKPKQRTELTPFGCPCSKSAHVCVHTEFACLMCMKCGSIARAGFVHSFHDLSSVNTTPKYRYQPMTYLAHHLTRLEGHGHPRFAQDVLTVVRKDLTSHGISLNLAMPNDVYATLKRLKLARLYPHRWALTKRVNPTYQPLCLSHGLRERLNHVFRRCYVRYASQRSKTGRKRKFLPYPLFIFHALQYLGVDDVQAHFKPLKNKTLARRYAHDVQRLLRGLSL